MTMQQSETDLRLVQAPPDIRLASVWLCGRDDAIRLNGDPAHALTGIQVCIDNLNSSVVVLNDGLDSPHLAQAHTAVQWNWLRLVGLLAGMPVTESDAIRTRLGMNRSLVCQAYHALVGGAAVIVTFRSEPINMSALRDVTITNLRPFAEGSARSFAQRAGFTEQDIRGMSN